MHGQVPVSWGMQACKGSIRITSDAFTRGPDRTTEVGRAEGEVLRRRFGSTACREKYLRSARRFAAGMGSHEAYPLIWRPSEGLGFPRSPPPPRSCAGGKGKRLSQEWTTSLLAADWPQWKIRFELVEAGYLAPRVSQLIRQACAELHREPLDWRGMPSPFDPY